MHDRSRMCERIKVLNFCDYHKEPLVTQKVFNLSCLPSFLFILSFHPKKKKKFLIVSIFFYDLIMHTWNFFIIPKLQKLKFLNVN